MRDTACYYFFGSRAPGRLERLLWRSRLPLYILLRCIATSGFSRDPEPA